MLEIELKLFLFIFPLSLNSRKKNLLKKREFETPSFIKSLKRGSPNLTVPLSPSIHNNIGSWESVEKSLELSLAISFELEAK